MMARSQETFIAERCVESENVCMHIISLSSGETSETNIILR